MVASGVIMWILVSLSNPQIQSYNEGNTFIYRSDCLHHLSYRQTTSPNESFVCKRAEISYDDLPTPIKDDLRMNSTIHDGHVQWKAEDIKQGGGIYGETHGSNYKPITVR